jgi:glycosyltransferase involved in cell wall biosynthesis
VVISEACHFPEVKTANAGSVVSLDAAEVAAALIDILQNPKMALMMGRNGRKLVRENYTWPRIAELTILGYRSGETGNASGVALPDHPALQGS